MRDNIKWTGWRRAATGAFVFLVAAGWTGGPGALPGTSALAQSYSGGLVADQSAAICSMVQTGLNGIGYSLTGAAREQAVRTALEQATTNAISIYGVAAVTEITRCAIGAGLPAAQVIADVMPAAAHVPGMSTPEVVALVTEGAVNAGTPGVVAAEAVIAAADLSNLSFADVGTGLGTAAAQLSPTNSGAAQQIAQAVSNEGTTGMGQAFSTAVLANGGSNKLAYAGTQNPIAVGEITQPTLNVNAGELGLSNNPPPPCNNPSCT